MGTLNSTNYMTSEAFTPPAPDAPIQDSVTPLQGLELASADLATKAVDLANTVSHLPFIG